MCHLREWGKLSVEVSSANEISKWHHAHFRNWAQRIHHPLDPPDSHFPRIRSVNWGNPLHEFIGPMESRTRVFGTSKRYPTLWHGIAHFDGLVMRLG